jgi:hypothetical protein
MRTLEYSIPDEIEPHVHSIENTNQFDTLFQHSKAKVQISLHDNTIGLTTPDLLSKIYQIQNNTGLFESENYLFFMWFMLMFKFCS